MISTAGGVLLAQTARITGLDRHLSAGVRPWRRSRTIHDPAKILVDLAITVALGGDCAADIALLRAQPGVFGMVASDPTVSRVIDDLADAGTEALTAIRAARAGARAWVWQRAGAPTQDGWIVLDPDATVLISHDEQNLVCQVRDSGYLTDPLAGRRPEVPGQLRGRGLLLVNALSDLVRVHTTPKGTTIEVRFALRKQLGDSR